jgi:hypothetical protein
MTDEIMIEAACVVMHNAYEKAAVGAGWETQEASRKPWEDVPEANKATMRAAVGALLEWLPSVGPFTAERNKPIPVVAVEGVFYPVGKTQ